MLLRWYADEFDRTESGDGMILICRKCGVCLRFTPYATEAAVDREILLHRRLHVFNRRRAAPPEIWGHGNGQYEDIGDDGEGEARSA